MESNHNPEDCGGKYLHLKLMENAGFNVPPTYCEHDLAPEKLSCLENYIVRSSSKGEDSLAQTAAGRNHSKKGVASYQVLDAIRQVKKNYKFGGVAIQPDLTDRMQYSGVCYTNLNGELVLSMGSCHVVQSIVAGGNPDVEIRVVNGNNIWKGQALEPCMIDGIVSGMYSVERYFGRPMDVEFAWIDNNLTLLQARPLPNPTDKCLRENEIRKFCRMTSHAKQLGLKEVVLGVGNYREILGDEAATPLSVSLFNYIFSGDGKSVLGAVQLGRNELGYETGFEVYPWVQMLGSKVYYNFAADALQFRPAGTNLEDLLKVVNQVYLPMVNAEPDLLNYPELRLYVQFPEQAKAVGLDPEPFRQLAESNRRKASEIDLPKYPPKKKRMPPYETPEACLGALRLAADEIRTNSAKEYVKAARLAFFALEDLRMCLDSLKEKGDEAYSKVREMFQTSTPEKLRDAIAYDESIGSFEVPDTEEYRYLGSFELTLPRGSPPKRHFRQGKTLPSSLESIVGVTRTVLQNRERVKFALLRDYDYLKQLVEGFGSLSGFKEDVFLLDFEDLPLATKEPTLAYYRIDLGKKMCGKQLFPDPVFEKDIYTCLQRNTGDRPQLVFGSLPGPVEILVGLTGHVVRAVDQTVEVPPQTKVVFVPENVKPGSHLFTVLSDYGVPVISMPSKRLNEIQEKCMTLQMKNGELEIICD